MVSKKSFDKVVRKFSFIQRSFSNIRKIESIIEERDRLFRERQILYDQSNNWRVFLANKYLTGKGIEIGPAEHPLAVPHWAKVTYVDEISTKDLIKRYPYLKHHSLVHIDVVDDGQTLSNFKDNSQNFIIANHFLEHVIDPIKTIRNFYRVLKPGGIIYMAIPDKRFTFDKLRPTTPLARLKNFHDNPKMAEDGKWPMFLEAVKWAEGEKEDRITKRAKELFDQKFSIHFNIWRQHDVLDLLLYIMEYYKLDIDFESVIKNEHELLLILRKQATLTSKEPASVKRVRRIRSKDKTKS